MPYANINRVYQAIKALADKQGHGFITSTQFNTLAPLGQLGVFDDLIEEFKAHNAAMMNFIDPIGVGGIQQTLDDLSTLYEYGATLTSSAGNNVFQKPSDFGYLDTISVDGRTVSMVSGKESDLIRNNHLIGGRGCGVHGVEAGGNINMCPATTTSGVTMNYYRIPRGIDASGNVSALGPVWNSTTVGNTATYNAATSNNFELPETCEQRLVIKIGAMIGLNIRDLDVVGFLENQEVKEINEQ